MWANNMEKKDIKKVASTADERLLNPKAYGGTDHQGREVQSSQDMFDSKGQLNAYDHKDVITQQQKFAGLMGQYKKTGSFYSLDEKQKIMEAAFGGNEEERMRFGAEMIPLILDRLDYEGFIRQVFKTHEVVISQGCRDFYDRPGQSRQYRQLFDRNNLPDVWPDIGYDIIPDIVYHIVTGVWQVLKEVVGANQPH